MAPIVGVEVNARLEPPARRRFGNLVLAWGRDDLELTSKRAFVRINSPGDKLTTKQAIKFFREILWKDVIPEVKKLMMKNGLKNWVITNVYLRTDSYCASSWQVRGHRFEGLNIKV